MRSITLISLLALSSTTVACNNEVPMDKVADTMSEDSSGPDEDGSSVDTEPETEDDADTDTDTDEVDCLVEDATPWYRDLDGDLYGAPDHAVLACERPPDMVEDATDCNDDDAAVNPGEDEVEYDGLDNDCDVGTLDDDLDGDGVRLADDCDDGDASTHPYADEHCEDGIDNDCDGAIDTMDSIDCGMTTTIPVDDLGAPHWSDDDDADDDADGDGYASTESGGDDCNDNDAAVNPDTTEFYAESSDGSWDYDCDGIEQKERVDLRGACALLLPPFCGAASDGWDWGGEDVFDDLEVRPPECGERDVWVSDCEPQYLGPIAVACDWGVREEYTQACN